MLDGWVGEYMNNIGDGEADDCGMWAQTVVTTGGGRRPCRLLYLVVGLLLFRTTFGTVVVES